MVAALLWFVRNLTIQLHPRRRRGPVTVYMVYRRRYSREAHQIVLPCLRAGWNVHLWALDQAAPELEPWTRGCGEGAKFALLNRLLEAAPPQDTETVVF